MITNLRIELFEALVSTSPPTLTVDTLALWRETIENITNTWDRHETNNSERLFCHPQHFRRSAQSMGFSDSWLLQVIKNKRKYVRKVLI